MSANTIIKSYTKYDVKSIFDSLDIRESTRYEYKHRIKPFLTYVQSEGFNTDTLVAYKRKLAATNDFSVSTKNKYLVTARIFLKECYRRGLVDRDVTANVKSFQQSKKHKVNGLNDSDVSLICLWMREHPGSLREKTLLHLLLFQGMRQAEICNLKLYDLQLNEGALAVLGKGMDDKEKINLHPKTVLALKKYTASIKLDPDDYLFVSQKKVSTSGKLTERGLRHIIKHIFSELDIDKTVHGFRHYYTTRLIRSMPGNLTVVAQFTRHRSLEMLQVYNDGVLLEKDLVHYHEAFNDLTV